MARSNKDRRLCRRACGGEDRLSALPDDLLCLVLRRLDTRDALATAALSRRWAGLPRELPALDFRVTDLLPPRYRRCLALREEARTSLSASEDGATLDAVAGRYEHRAMAASVKALLVSRARRRAGRLSLDVFDYDTSASINQLIVTAVDSWGIKDLEVSAAPTGPIVHPPPVYSFPHGRISRNPGASRVQRLKLSNCLPPPLEGFHSLTTLVLQGLLHVHHDSRHSDEELPCQEETVEIPWPNSASRHRHLKELVVIDFQRTERRHVQLVRFAMEASTTALRRVALYRRGHVELKGPGLWEVARQPCAWSDEERRGVLDLLAKLK